MTHLLRAALLLSLATPAWAVPPQAPGAEVEAALNDEASWDAERWITEVDARIGSLPGFRYSARRTTTRGETAVEERWRFVLFGGDKFRIDYFGDTARQITCDGVHLVDYIPAMGKALRLDLAALEAEERASTLAKVLQHVGVPGLRLGAAKDVDWTMTREEDEEQRLVRLDGVGQDGTTIMYLIDADRFTVHHITMTQKGQTVLDARPSDHREVHPGIYFPHQIDLSSPDKGGMATVAIRLTKVSPLSDSPDNLFTTTLDPSIPIEEEP